MANRNPRICVPAGRKFIVAVATCSAFEKFEAALITVPCERSIYVVEPAPVVTPPAIPGAPPA